MQAEAQLVGSMGLAADTAQVRSRSGPPGQARRRLREANIGLTAGRGSSTRAAAVTLCTCNLRGFDGS